MLEVMLGILVLLLLATAMKALLPFLGEPLLFLLFVAVLCVLGFLVWVVLIWLAGFLGSLLVLTLRHAGIGLLYSLPAVGAAVVLFALVFGAARMTAPEAAGAAVRLVVEGDRVRVEAACWPGFPRAILCCHAMSALLTAWLAVEAPHAADAMSAERLAPPIARPVAEAPAHAAVAGSGTIRVLTRERRGGFTREPWDAGVRAGTRAGLAIAVMVQVSLLVAGCACGYIATARAFVWWRTDSLARQRPEVEADLDRFRQATAAVQQEIDARCRMLGIDWPHRASAVLASLLPGALTLPKDSALFQEAGSRSAALLQDDLTRLEAAVLQQNQAARAIDRARARLRQWRADGKVAASRLRPLTEELEDAVSVLRVLAEQLLPAREWARFELAALKLIAAMDGIAADGRKDNGPRQAPAGNTARPSAVDQALLLLGLARGASHEAVKKAYRQAAFRHHPDRGGNAETFKQIARAYQLLAAQFEKEKTACS